MLDIRRKQLVSFDIADMADGSDRVRFIWLERGTVFIKPANQVGHLLAIIYYFWFKNALLVRKIQKFLNPSTPVKYEKKVTRFSPVNHRCGKNLTRASPLYPGKKNKKTRTFTLLKII